MDLKVDYIELASEDMTASREFMEAVFGWSFTDYGDSYTAFSKDSAGIDGGITVGDPTGGPLVVICTDTLEEAFARVKATGAEITKDIFGFPGGQRFEFVAPGGIRLAIWTQEADPKDA